SYGDWSSDVCSSDLEQQRRERKPAPQRCPASRFPGGPRDHAEHERAERRAPVEARAAVEELQVGRLQHVLGRASIPAAAAQRPPEGGGVQLLQLGGQVGSHGDSYRSMSVFWGWII